MKLPGWMRSLMGKDNHGGKGIRRDRRIGRPRGLSCRSAGRGHIRPDGRWESTWWYHMQRKLSAPHRAAVAMRRIQAARGSAA